MHSGEKSKYTVEKSQNEQWRKVKMHSGEKVKMHSGEKSKCTVEKSKLRKLGKKKAGSSNYI